MDQFIASCNAAPDYPRNIINHNTYEYILRAYTERLNEQERRIFSDETKAAQDFWEFDDSDPEFRHSCVHNADELKTHLRMQSLPGYNDPRCRFVHAPHSRERLKITREMLVMTLTYHQVMPSFLDFVFPYGRQEYAQDFYFSGFRHDSHVRKLDSGLKLPEIGRSGKDIRLCYNLRSAEKSAAQEEWPWSIRQSSFYHSFDMETGRSIWMIVKGDQSVKRRVMSATKSNTAPELAFFSSEERAFCETLDTHMIFCDWSGENWRWYINFLEGALQDTTRRILSVSVETISSPMFEKASFLTTQRTISPIEEIPWSPGSERATPALTIQPSPLGSPNPEVPSLRSNETRTSKNQNEFSFSDLQRIQFIEEKANETLLVLKANTNVIAELKEHYLSLLDPEVGPSSDWQGRWKVHISRFERRVAAVENDLQMQQSRAETLLRLLADRKSLLYGILEYRGMEASKLLAEKAQLSATNMEAITRDMHELTRKTKQETVSMRIITLVTLFFLPGTFISTLMSTDIVHYHTGRTGKSEKVVQLGALQLFLAISLPLMFGTFSAWYGVYWWVNRQDRSSKFPVESKV